MGVKLEKMPSGGSDVASPVKRLEESDFYLAIEENRYANSLC